MQEGRELRAKGKANACLKSADVRRRRSSRIGEGGEREGEEKGGGKGRGEGRGEGEGERPEA